LVDTLPVTAAADQGGALVPDFAVASGSLFCLQRQFAERFAEEPVSPRELSAVLGTGAVDLARISELFRRDPSVANRVTRVVNCSLFGLRSPVTNLAEAAVLLGVERLRALALTCSVMGFSHRELNPATTKRFWRHSCLVGMLAERAANWLGYPAKDLAHVAGLLHDIGQLPFCFDGNQQAENAREGSNLGAGDPGTEQAACGANHLQLGRWMGISWDLHPAFIDVLENHHEPEKATFDPMLVSIVAAADEFCITRGFGASASFSRTDCWFAWDGHRGCVLPQLSRAEFTELTEFLDSELVHLLPFVEWCAGYRSTESRSELVHPI
jgi:putative nucleotidyltransferase with HDIG domain